MSVNSLQKYVKKYVHKVKVNPFLLIPWQDKHMVEWQNHLIWCKKTLMLHAAANFDVILGGLSVLSLLAEK